MKKRNYGTVFASLAFFSVSLRKVFVFVRLSTTVLFEGRDILLEEMWTSVEAVGREHWVGCAGTRPI